MPRMGIYDQVKSAIQDIVAPALHEIRGEIQAMHADIRGLDQKIDGVDRELRTAIDIRERLAALEARRT
jgi:hypothetical protein